MLNLLIALLCVSAAAFVVLIAVSSPRNPKRFARMIARQQRMALNTLRKNNPSLTREQLYYKALATRVTLEEDALRRLITKAGRDAKNRGTRVRFNELVSELVIQEYKKRLPPRKQDLSRVPEMTAAVKSAIPDDI